MLKDTVKPAIEERQMKIKEAIVEQWEKGLTVEEIAAYFNFSVESVARVLGQEEYFDEL